MDGLLGVAGIILDSQWIIPSFPTFSTGWAAVLRHNISRFKDWDLFSEGFPQLLGIIPSFPRKMVIFNSYVSPGHLQEDGTITGISAAPGPTPKKRMLCLCPHIYNIYIYIFISVYLSIYLSIYIYITIYHYNPFPLLLKVPQILKTRVHWKI